MKIAPIVREEKRLGWLFFCPACKHGHSIQTAGDRSGLEGPTWTFNGDQEKPSIMPSILVRSHLWTPPVTGENMDEWREKPWSQTKVETVCHSYVSTGKIMFLGDCTHSLAGQTVDLPDL